MNQEMIEISATKNQQHMSQVQRAARLVPNDVIAVVDSHTQEKIGTVVNFNAAGMQLLITKDDCDLYDILELTLVNKNAQSKLQYINVIAELLWMKKAEDQQRMVAGFYLSAKNFKSKFRLNQLIQSVNK